MAAITLTPYQRRWITDRSRFKVGMMARQAGKTFSATLEIVDDCMDAEATGRRVRWVILSRGERQALEAMEEGVLLHLRAYGAAFEALEYEFEPEIKAFEVALSRGSRITALPANPATARGFSASVLLDEFAFHHDSRKIWQALFPVISRGDRKLRVISTPNGKNNKFFDLMTGTDPIWNRHVVDIYQAVADGLPRDVEELRRGIADDDAWEQEYELKWLDEASAWLSYELISACEHDAAGLPERYEGGPVYVGVDIAARNDLFVIWAAEKIGDVLWTRDVIVRRRISFAEQDALLAQVMKRYTVVRCCMDQSGMGEKPVEDAIRRYGEARLEGVLFTATAKQQLASVGKRRFDERAIRIPMGDEALRGDLHSLRKEQTPLGAPRFVVDRDGDSHADRAWACFLCCYAAAGSGERFGYRPVTAPKRDEEFRRVRCTGGFRRGMM